VSQRVGDSLTWQVGESGKSLRQKRQHRNRLFAHEGRLFPFKIREKDQNMTIFGYSCGLQSSLYTKKHCFTLKVLIFGPKKLPLNLSKVY
jgi:hypothetical protein